MPFIGEPEPGYYKLRLAKGGLHVAVRIWFGPPIYDGEELDRSPRLCIEVDGKTERWAKDADGNLIGREPLDPHEFWAFCGGSPISQREYHFLLRRKNWAVEHDPTHPAARPHQPIDIRSLKPGW